MLDNKTEDLKKVIIKIDNSTFNLLRDNHYEFILYQQITARKHNIKTHYLGITN